MLIPTIMEESSVVQGVGSKTYRKGFLVMSSYYKDHKPYKRLQSDIEIGAENERERIKGIVNEMAVSAKGLDAGRLIEAIDRIDNG